VVTTAALLAACVWATPVLADRFCSVPLADWQPREALLRRLEAEGLTVLGIRADDGCYKVLARTPDGDTIKRRFDPATLEPIERGGGGRGRHGWRGGDHD
jgi:hypothetical protein